MSAFVVSKHDIDILVTAYLALRAGRKENPDRIGRTLWRENVDSVAYRYNMPDRHFSEHEAYLKDIAAYRHEPILAKAAAVAKVARCYDYQACEHDDWHGSEAKAIADALMAAFPETLPGYEAMPWGVANGADLFKVRV